MPIIKSAKKRVRVAEKAAIRNSKVKRAMRNTLKSFQASLSNKNAAATTKAYNEAQHTIDTAVKKNIIHKNKAARTKANLAKKMKDAGVKPTTGKAKSPAKAKATTKPATKKAAPKKPATKKPAAKKTTSKSTKK